MRKPPPSGGFLFLEKTASSRRSLLACLDLHQARLFYPEFGGNKKPRLLMLRALDLPLRQADLGGFGHLADDDEEGEFVE